MQSLRDDEPSSPTSPCIAPTRLEPCLEAHPLDHLQTFNSDNNNRSIYIAVHLFGTKGTDL